MGFLWTIDFLFYPSVLSLIYCGCQNQSMKSLQLPLTLCDTDVIGYVHFFFFLDPSSVAFTLVGFLFNAP